MDIDRLAKRIAEKTEAELKSIGDEEYPEYQLTFHLEDDRKQEINLFPVEEDRKSFVRMITFIGKKSEFLASKFINFLELNMSLRYGSFAIYQGQVVLQNMMPYSSVVDEEKVIDSMKYLVEMADKFESQLVGLDRK